MKRVLCMQKGRAVLNVLFLLFAVFSATLLCAQQPLQEVSGKVVGQDSLPLPGVAVIMQGKDSVYIDAATTDAQGCFKLPRPAQAFYLQFQHLAYETRFVEPASGHVGTIVLADADNELSEVVVTAQRPLMKMENGVLTCDLTSVRENKITDNAFDLAKELPLIADDNGSLSLAGAPAGVAVVINGKPSAMGADRIISYLKSLPADRVEKVEIMYNAPARWHIRGAAINIVLKKAQRAEWQGQAKGSWKYNRRGENTYTAEGSLFVSDEKWACNIIYDYGNLRSVTPEETKALHTVGSDVYDIYNMSETRQKQQSHSLYGNVEYSISDKSRIEVSYDGQFVPSADKNALTVNNRFSTADSRDKTETTLHNAGVVYDAPFGLRVGGYYTYYLSKGGQDMAYKKGAAYTDAFHYNRQQQIDRYSAFADMTHTLGDGWNLNYGVKFDYAKDESKQAYVDKENKQGDSYEASATEEYVSDVYAGFSRWFLDNRLGVDITLYGDYYQLADYRKYTVQPNMTLSYTPVSDHFLQLSFLRMRYYPSYWDRQDYVYRLNEYSVSVGNPELRPYINNILSFYYVLKSRYTFYASLVKTKDFIRQQPYQLPDRLIQVSKSLNIDDGTSFLAGTSLPVRVCKFLDTEIGLSVYHDSYQMDDWFGMAYDCKKWTYMASADNTFTLCSKPRVTMNVVAYYKSPSIEGVWDVGEMWAVNAGLKCAFAKEKAVLSLQCNDMFDREMPVIRTRIETQNQDLHTDFYRRSVYLSFSYKFNGYKEHRKPAVDTSRFGTK